MPHIFLPQPEPEIVTLKDSFPAHRICAILLLKNISDRTYRMVRILPFLTKARVSSLFIEEGLKRVKTNLKNPVDPVKIL